MNVVDLSVLLGLIVLNFVGLGIYHYEYKQEFPDADWKKDKNFWAWTIGLILFGVFYTSVRFILWIRSWFQH